MAKGTTPTAGLPAWLRVHQEGVTVTLALQPGSKLSAIVGVHGDALKVKIAAPPVDGAANAALLEFLVERLGVRRHQLRLLRGATSRLKVVEIIGLNAILVAERLAPPVAN